MKTACWLLLLASTPLGAQSWSPQAAAGYLDGRLEWWSTWSSSQRDHQTFCISCHTVLPYALSRQSLRPALHESASPAPEATLLANLTKRVHLWKEVEPFYPDNPRGPGKTLESRGTESVLNALALVANHAPKADVTLALANMVAQQITAGDDAGSWPWLQFHNAPWEGDSQFFGTTLAALAFGMAPESDRDQLVISRMNRYLTSHRAGQTLMDRTFLLWASTLLPGLLPASEKQTLIAEILSKQSADGGFSLSSFVGNWQRKDKTPLETRSDGYATGVVSLVLGRTGMAPAQEPLRRSLAWLRANQDPSDGRWPAWSLNKQRELSSDAGRFMSDAATSFAVMALTAGDAQ